MKTTNYVPTTVGPTLLQKTLEYCVNIGDVGKEKCCIITDVAKLRKLLGKPAITDQQFFAMYDNWTVYQLVIRARDLASEYTGEIHQPLQGQDF